jgi:LysR family transcriptional regulator, glycine cleavage system transcriptional activator
MDSKHRRPRLSLDLLKGFEAAARHLSFTRAARELSLTQSAVSREIKTLEEQLGRSLFIRVNRGLRLTDAGQGLYRAVGEALKLIDEATDRLAVSRGRETLAVTTSAALASMWLVPKLPRFIQLHPGVDVRTVAADQRFDLERERLDLAIRWAPPGSSAPGGEPLFDVQMFPVCSPTLARDPARPLRRPADLVHHVLLDLETLTASGPWSDWGPWLEAMKLADLKPGGTLHFSHYDQVVQAAIDGSGVAIGRNPHSARYLRDGLLFAPFGREAVLRRGTYFVLIPPRSAERPVVKDFVAWLRDEVRKDAEADTNREGSIRHLSARPAATPRTRRR